MRQLGQEAGVGDADEADHLAGEGSFGRFDGPVAEAMLGPVLGGAVEEGCRRRGVHAAVEELGHRRVGVDRRHRGGVRGAPATQDQALRPQGLAVEAHSSGRPSTSRLSPSRRTR